MSTNQSGLTAEEEQRSTDLLTVMGNALASWQGVEHEVSELYLSFFPDAAADAAAVIFYAARVFDARLTFVDSLVRFFCPDPIKSEWKKLHKRVREKAMKRNEVAHGIYVLYGPKPNREPMISPSIYDIARFPGVGATKNDFISTKQIGESMASFHDLMLRLQAFRGLLQADQATQAALASPDKVLFRNRRNIPIRTRTP